MTRSLLVFLMVFTAIVSVLSALPVTGAYKAQAQNAPAQGSQVSWCNCYRTRGISWNDFMTNGTQINEVETQCRRGYFITSIKQTAEKMPYIFGQYIFSERVECCQPCWK